jgi:hypothetical protein
MKNEVNVMLRDKTGGTVESSDLTVFFNKALSQVRLRSKQPVSSLPYSFEVIPSVFEYPAPTDYLGIIDFYRRNGERQLDVTSGREFRHERRIGTFRRMIAKTNVFEKQIFNINAERSSIVTAFNKATWTASGDANSVKLSKDTEYPAGEAVTFNFTHSSGTGAIATTNLDSVNISGVVDRGFAILDVFLDNVDNLTSVTLRVGSDASNYYQMVNAIGDNAMQDYVVGKNTLLFSMKTATTAGTPDPDGITYVQVILAKTSTVVGVGVTNLRFALPIRYDMNYYSSHMVKGEDGAYKTEFTEDSDTSLLRYSDDQLLVEVASAYAFRKMRDYDDMSLSNQTFEQLFRNQRINEPSEETRPTNTYYKAG